MIYIVAMATSPLWPAALVFAVTYAILGIQGIPRIHIDRPSGALLGATGMVALGVLTLEQAYRAIALDTLLFLLGMMILIADLELSGFFEVLERWIIGLARSTAALLALVIGSAGLLAALSPYRSSPSSGGRSKFTNSPRNPLVLMAP